MTINNDAIMKKVRAYARSDEGKQRIKGRVDEARTTGKKLASGSKVTTEQDMAQLAERLATSIRNNLPEQIKEVGEFLYVSTPYRLKDGTYKIALSFDRAAVHRDSLSSTDSPNSVNFPKKKDGSLYRGRTEERRQDSMDMYGAFTGGGIDNIVALFNNGHDPNGENYGKSVFGFWKTGGGNPDGLWSDYVWVRSKNDREPLRFMNEAVAAFNSQYGSQYGVTAVLSSEYIGGTDAE